MHDNDDDGWRVFVDQVGMLQALRESEADKAEVPLNPE